jgi:murein L,D-transpeptidase YafK
MPAREDALKEPRIVVLKSERRLELYDEDLLIGAYPIALGREPAGDKKAEGDGRTPEGNYYICTRNEQSRFYLSMGISYPNVEDAEEALDSGTIDSETYDRISRAAKDRSKPPWDTPLGGEIMIHGMGSYKDWTEGCVAVNNDVMDLLFTLCPLGTPVFMKP